jgi:hypothetical protein
MQYQIRKRGSEFAVVLVDSGMIINLPKRYGTRAEAKQAKRILTSDIQQN